MTPAELAAIAIGCVVSVIAWFIKRDVGRFERAVEKQSDILEKHSTMLATMQSELARVIAVGNWEPNLQRFFGEGGGQARLWASVEALEKDVEQLRERDHWVVNKLAVIKARTDSCGCSGDSKDQTDWALPEWRTADRRGYKK
jgi:hypothetical protein